MATPAEEDRDPALQQTDTAEEVGQDLNEDVKTAKRQRGRKASVFTRMCTTIDGLLSRHADADELKKRMEALNAALDGFLETNDTYVALLEDTGEIEEAGQYASRITQKHSEIINRVQQALEPPPRRAASTELVGSRVSGSIVSRGSRTSAVSKGVEITAELKALELQQLRARRKMEAERRKKEELMEAERRKQESERKEQEAQMEIRVMEDELERARLEARLWRAAESELTWERRNDFQEDDNGAEPSHSSPTSVLPVTEEQTRAIVPSEQRRPPSQSDDAAAALGVTRSRPNAINVAPAGSMVLPDNTATAQVKAGTQSQSGQKPDDWLEEMGSNVSPQSQNNGQSAFVKSIPRLSLPTFNGNPREWPRWIGLFKALVHDQPSLTDTERMAHLQSAVDGAASQAIDGMLFNGSLYQEALLTLRDRFGREEDITQAHLRSIFSATPPSVNDLPAMEKFYSVVHNAVTVLRNLGFTSDLASSENLRRVVDKLPSELSRDWGAEVFRLRPKRPTLETFSVWLKTQVGILSYSATKSSTHDRKHAAPRSKDGTATKKSAFVTQARCPEEVRSQQACAVCKAAHRLVDCAEFKAKTPDARMDIVCSEGLCFACLRKGHWSRRCRSARKCQVEDCKFTHHRLLHGSKKRTEADNDASKGKGAGSTPFVAASLSEETDTLLQVVQVRIHGASGSKDVLALLDSGAQTSLCSEDILQELGITGDRRQLCIQNVEGSGAQKSSQRVTLTVNALGAGVEGDCITIPEAWSVPALNVTAPTVTQRQLERCDHLRGLQFPQYSGGDVKLLLGGNVLEAVLQKEARVGRPNQPVAVRTEFGWTLAGSVSAVVPNSMRQIMFLQRRTEEEDLASAVKEWWSTEAFGTKYSKEVAQSKEDQRALSILERSTRKLEGRYETGMLWRDDDVGFPDNKGMALKRLQATERSLQRRPELASAYQETMRSYIQEGHARKLTVEEASKSNSRRWFLPHHAVTNPNKPGKVRVVFDAAARCKGTSLNDKLLTGPDLLRALPGVLLRFREEPVALTADIEKMYHQVRVAEEDQPALSFLWRDLDTTKAPDVYQMQVVVFGAKSSPAMANYVLHKTAEDYGKDTTTGCPAAVDAVYHNFYMDDFLRSEKNPEAAMVMRQEVTKLASSGGFRLTKWLSNSREVLESIPISERALDSADLSLSLLPSGRTLGVIWNSEDDTLSFRVTEATALATKREVLRQTASVFDPLGVGAPFILRAKVLMQHLWALELEWDEDLPDSENARWKQWLQELQGLKEVKVPRCITPASGDVVSRQFHVFCDASEAAFGAVIYLRTSLVNGENHCSFVMSKTRVAPLKQMSIVRLELQAAVLAARLMDTVLKEVTVETHSVTFWTDSRVVLQYINNESRRFHVFVANRIAEIQDLTERKQWRHVPGAMNPADDCSRGLAASDLTADCRWLRGPDFLWQSEEKWPTTRDASPLRPDQEEVKEAKFAGVTIKVQPALPDSDRFSSWTKFRRVVAWMRRYLNNLAAKCVPSRVPGSRSGPLTAQEMMEAETVILRHEQAEMYQSEINALQSGNPLQPKSELLSLAPYLDADNLLRVGGRLRHSPLTEAEKHPIILPRKRGVTRMIIADQHGRLLHAGVEHTLNELRGRFWIPRGRSEVKKNLHGCAVCRNRRAIPQPPMMANMPAERFDTSRPFSTVGIDYLGPLSVRKFRRTEKRYVLLVTCLATRAVHLEVACSLDTDSFIMALHRFMARRGKPTKIISDNGTNFVGGERELGEAIKSLEQERIMDELSQKRIEWHFITPAASHMGGAWERLVSSVKRALRVVLGANTVSDEVLSSALCEVEHIINSRPLTYVSSDATDFRALTPNHLLIGSDSPHLPPGVFGSEDLSTRKKWRHAQALASHFWKRWSKEYVPTLTVRKKWQRDVRNVGVGDLVLLADPNSPRGLWPLARVTQVFPGPDGRVRSVEIKTSGGGVYRRPAVKIAVLEESIARN